MFLAGFTSLSALLLFPLLITFFIFVHSFWFYIIKQTRFYRSTHLLMFLSFEMLRSIIRTGSPILVELISNDLAQMVNFPMRIPDWDSHSPALLDLLLCSDASIFSAKAFPPLGNSDHVVLSVSIDVSLQSLWIFSFWLGRSLWLFERCSMGLNSVLLLLLLLVNFVSGFRLEFMYISLIENIRSNLTHLHGFQLLVLLS